MSKYTKKVIKSYERDFSKAEECFKKDEFEIARKYFERLYSYYSKRSDISLTRLILTRLHTIYKKIEDFDSIIRIINQLLTIENKFNPDENTKGKLYQELAYIYITKGDLTESEKYFIKSLEEETRQDQIALTNFGYGILKKFQGEYEESLNYHHKSLTICKELGFDHLSENIYGEITVTYDELNDLDNLRKYFNEHKQLIEKSNDKERIGTFFLNSAAFYDSIEGINREEALKNVLEIAQEYMYEKLEALALMNTAYLHKDDEDIVDKYYDKALKIGEKLNNQFIVSKCYQLIGETCYLNKKFDQAIEFMRKSLKITKERKDIFSLIRNYELLGMTYREIDNFHDSYINYSQALRQYQYILNNLNTNELRRNFETSFNQLPELIDELYQLIEEGKVQPEFGDIDEITRIMITLCQKSRQFGNISTELLKKNIRNLNFLKLQDQIITELIETIPTYKNKIIEKSEVLLYLDQFPTIDLKKSMLKILSRIKHYYFTFDDMTNSLRKEFNSLPISPSTIIFFAIPDDLWNKSNTFWTYFIKKTTNRRISLNKSSDIITRLEKLQGNQEIFVVFVDDVIGSGNQFVESFLKFFSNEFIEKGFNKKENISIYLLAGIGSVQSFNLIETKTLIIKDRIRYSKKIGIEDKAFSKKCWSDEKELSNLVSFLKKIDPKHWDGRKESDSERGQEYLVILDWNTPNNTISCLWKELNNWKALFPRT